jgi:anti-anti-sigma regulatory factor
LDGLVVTPVLPLRNAGVAQALDELELRLDTALATGPRVVVVDMSAIGQVSSTTIAALLWVKRRCASRGVEVLLRGPSRRNLDTLRRVGLLGVFHLEGALSHSSRPDSASVYRPVPR